MTERQTLRWWQDEEQNKVAKEAVERVSLAPTSLLPAQASLFPPVAEPVALVEEQDIWEDLEAEAVRRAGQVKTEGAEEVSFYLDSKTAVRRYYRELRNWVFAFTIMKVLLFVQKVALTSPALEHIQYELALIDGLCQMVVVLPYFILYFYLKRRWVQNMAKPVLRLSPQGIHLRVVPGTIWPFFRSDVLVPWQDIAGVRPKKLFAYCYLEIYSKKVGKIAVGQNDLSVSTDELASQIADYRAARETA